MTKLFQFYSSGIRDHQFNPENRPVAELDTEDLDKLEVKIVKFGSGLKYRP